MHGRDPYPSGYPRPHGSSHGDLERGRGNRYRGMGFYAAGRRIAVYWSYTAVPLWSLLAAATSAHSVRGGSPAGREACLRTDCAVRRGHARPLSSVLAGLLEHGTTISLKQTKTTLAMCQQVAYNPRQQGRKKRDTTFYCSTGGTSMHQHCP